MKAKSIRYSIQNPCGASWDDMKHETGGRFCGSCEKSVVDFTVMSDFSIVNYLENHQHEKVCGRFTKPQLDRVYSLNQPVFAPVFDLRAVVLGLALTTFSAVHSFAQTESQVPVKADTTLQQDEPIMIGKVLVAHYNHENEKKASGTVSNLAVNYEKVKVILKTSEGKMLKTVKPDVNGKFEFDLNWKLKPAVIEVSGVGYETQERYLSRLQSLSNIRIALHEQVETIRGEVIQGDVQQTNTSEDQILKKIEIGNVTIQKSEK